MLILAIESSAAPVSAALYEDGRILAEFYVHTKQTHSETLMPMVEALLSTGKKTVKDLDLLAVAAGPGSFTGVRIGVSTVKGIAFPQDTPCCAVSTLDAMAYNAAILEGSLVCAVMDARCGQVYNALFRITDGEPVRLCEDRAISVADLAEECRARQENFILLGDGTAVCEETLEAAGARPAPESMRFQRACSVAMAAERLFKQGKTVSGTDLVPYYLRPPQAERERNKKRKGSL